MLTKCFSILDMKAGYFLVPFFSPAEGAAIRICMDLCADPNTMMSRHPGDFALYLIGTFDDATGLLQVQAPFNHLGGFEAFMPTPSRPLGLYHSAPPSNGNGETTNG